MQTGLGKIDRIERDDHLQQSAFHAIFKVSFVL